ncbi:MAG: hypothetical protein Q4C50_06590 [Eubacteriales bacterium]|nr:hypothetical protein [Eubacteriales bacterium]
MKVTYDRQHSSITEFDFSKVDLDKLLEGFDWLYPSGITPAMSALPTVAVRTALWRICGIRAYF